MGTTNLINLLRGELMLFNKALAISSDDLYHNDLKGLNAGDYKHLTTEEKNKFSNFFYEDKYIIVELYNSINNINGSVLIPNQSEILLNRYKNTNALLVQLDLNEKTTNEVVRNISGDIIEVELNENGEYSLNEIPYIFPIGIIYQIKIDIKNISNIPLELIINKFDIEVKPNVYHINYKSSSITPYSGTIDSGTINTLVDINANWINDQWKDYIVRIQRNGGTDYEYGVKTIIK